MKIAIGSNWKDVRKNFLTKEETLSDMRVAIMSELIEADMSKVSVRKARRTQE